MADGDKKWWQIFKREEPQPPEVATQEPEYYRKEKGIDPKLEFQEQRDKLIHHPEFERMTDSKKKEALNLFFDSYGNRYLDQINQTDPGVREEVRKQWLDRMYGEISGKVPEPTPQQKKTKIEDTYELPDWLQDGKNYQEVTQPVDNLRVATTRTPEDDQSVREHYSWLSQEIPSVTDKLLNSNEFGYLKSRPDLFYIGGEESVKAVDKWLKDNTELGYTDRSYVQNYLNQKAKDEMTNVLKQKYTGNLAEDTRLAAEPYIDPERKGYLDPDTDTYTPEPETKESAEFASLLDKSSNDLAALVLNSSGQSKMATEKQKLADEYAKLEEEGQKLQQMEAENEKWAEGLDTGDEDYYNKYTEWITNANKARQEYVKKIEAFNEKTNEFNQSLTDVPKEIPGNKSMEDRLNDYVQGSYLRWQNYEQQYNTAARQYRGEEPSLKTPSTKTLAQLNKLRYQAKAEFIAGSRMLYNQEGPLSIERDKEYKAELFTTAAQRSLGWGKKGEELSFFDEPRQSEILSNMYGIGQEVGMQFTDEELDAFNATMGERILEGSGSLLPAMPDLLLLGGTTGAMKGAFNIGRWTKGYQIVRNKALGKAAVIGLDETPGTGWEVVRMFKPTKLQKVTGTIAGGILDEAVFSGVGGFQFGTITGMNATHALIPEIKLKGKYQMFNPILDIFTRSGAGATIGMEAGGAMAGLTESLLSDKPVDVSIQENFPSVSETSQRVLEEFIVNSILFGGQGAIMRGVSKAKVAPAGMEFNRFGNMNWTGYLNPRVRARYYEAAKEFESKGFTDAANTLYRWLDIYKDPIKGSEIKQGRMENLEESLSILPTGQLREMRDVYGLAIKAMEYQSRQPGFTGELVIPIRSYTDVKPGSVVSTKETEMTEGGPKETVNHWEVISRQDNRNGFPVKYEAVHTETGEKRTFEPKVSDIEGKRTTYFDFDPTVKFKLKNSLQVPFTLEAMYEHYSVLDKILLGRDINPPKLKIGPGERGEVTPEGEFIPLPPEKTKIEKKREEIARREQEMREETGMEPIEMPEPKRVYSYGEPEKITEMGVGEFHDNVKGAYQERDDQIAELRQKIEGLRDDLATKWKGRLNQAERQERQAAENEIARTELAIEKLQTEWGGELRDFLGESQDYINNAIRGMVPGITDPEVKEIRDDLWQKLMGPEEGERSMSIEELIKATIDEKTTEGEGVAPEVQPTEGEEVQPPEEEMPEEGEKEYRYIMRARPFDIGTFPEEGFVRYEPEGSKFGTVIYNRKMPIEEFKKWEFIPETELQEAASVEYSDEYHARIVPEWKGTVVTIKMFEKATDTEPVDQMDLTPADFLTNVQTGYFKPVVPEEAPPPEEIAPEDLPMDVTEEEVTPTTEGERMREAGERTVLGVKYVRQPPLTKEAEGGVTNVRFSKKESPEAIWTIMEMKDLQPSHLMGTENPRHFLPEAQPRNRANLKSLADAAREKSQNLDPEQLMYSPNAYSGAPVVNERGEVIQGNGRAEALIYYYQTTARDPKGYKKKLAKELENLGLAKTDLDKFEEPVLVRKMYVEDPIAIRLGNFGMRDLEDVQEDTSQIKQASNRMTQEQGITISNVLLKGNEADDTLNDLIRKNAGELLQKLTEYDVFSQGDAERFRRGGEITPQGISAIEGVIKGLFFKGGNNNLPEIFEELPHVVKKGIEKSMPILLRIPAANNLLPQVRNALMGLYEYDQYLRSTGETSAFQDWVRQTSMYEAPVQERFTPLELAMIEKFATAKRQSDIVRAFMDYENLVKGKAASLFEGASEGIPRSQATEQVFGQPYEKTIDDEYEEVTEVPTEREGEVPGGEPEKGEGTEKEPPVQKVNVKKDLDDMTALLGSIDFSTGPTEAAGGKGEIDPRERMINIARGVIKKMIDADITRFDEIMTEIIPDVSLNTLKMLLPFLRQGYTVTYFKAPEDVKAKMDYNYALSFDEADLDNLIAQMNKSTDPDTFEDIVDKRFFVTNLGKYIEVVRIEEWDDPKDQKIEMMGGLFGDLPPQFDKLQVAILKEDPITGKKFGMLVDKMREYINKGSFAEVPPYDNIEYRDALNKIIKGYQQIGMTDKAAELERLLWKEPKRALKKEGTWQEEIDRLNRQLKIEKEHDDYLTGRQKFDPLPEVPVLSTDQVLDIVNELVERGELIDVYIKKYMPADLLQDVVDFHNEIRKIYAQLGFMPMDTPYFLKGFDAGSIIAALYGVGAKGRAVERGRKGATKEQIDSAIGYVRRTLEDERKKIDITKASAMAWDLKYRFWNGKDFPKKYAGIVSIAKDWGITGKQAIRDAYELFMVEVARTYAQDATKDRHAQMLFIQSLYDTVPKISETARTAEVRELQQFSTPVPLGYLMGAWANADVVDNVFEPQAGVGALLIAAKKSSVKANELDPKRWWRLLYQGYSATNFDSMHGIKDKIAETQFDAIMMNPPFGGPKEDYHGFELRGEYIPIAYNLEMLSDVGKAAFISGGHLDFDKDGWIQGAKEKTFINWLSKHYNIADIIQLDGKLYEKMGTKYPIKVFLVNGRKAVPESKPVNESDFNFIPVEDWNGVRYRIFNQITKPNERSVLQGKVDAERGNDSIVDGPNPTERPGKRDTGPDAVSEGPVPPTNRPGEGGSSGPPNRGLPGSSTGNVTEGPTPPDIERPGIPKSTGGVGSQVKGGFAGSFGEIPAPRSGDDLPVNNIGKPTERTKRDIGLSKRTGDEVTNYVPLSQNGGNQYTVPASLAPAIERALIMLQDEVGDVDEYVMKMLNYKSVDEFKKALFGAQVDGVAQAVYNIEQGEAMIIGHQTGSGKGRIAAGVAAYAIENGKLPVFITKSADLFTDIWRDFMGIGKGQYEPFIMNRKFASSGQKVRVFNQTTGATIFEADEALINHVIGTPGSPGTFKIPPEFDMVFTTYSQFQNAKTDTAKRDFLMNLARTQDVVFIMDESHSASGKSNTGEFFMDWVAHTGGGTFLSATYAKRPDNMPLYAMKSVMREANMPLDGMVDAIINGGPALQEILTMHLAEAGQFSKIGIQVDADVNYLILGDDDPTQRTYKPDLGPEMIRKYDEVIDVIQDIIDFQRVYVTPLLKEMDKAIKRSVGGGIAATTGTTQAGVSNTPYFSRVWNIIDQLLMALKVDEMIPLLLEDLQKGIKPIVFVRSTMEAVFNEMKDMEELAKGDVIDMDFSYIFKRGMRTVMKYTETDEGNQKSYKLLDVEDLSPAGQEAYFRLIERIQEASTGINLSPIDVIRKRMEEAGYKTVELTGRDSMFELSDDLKTGKWMNNDRGDKIKAVATFNNNTGYVAIANTAATTGISMHPNKDVRDQSPRSSYFAQLFLNINEQIQAFGRTGRVGQLHRPIYNMMTSMLPAEKRAFMMIARKLKSLDANTSGNQKHSSNMVDVPDFLNKYGDEAVIEFLKDNPDINLLMGDPFNVDGAKDDTEIKVHNAAYRATGKIQILPSHLQEFFHEDVIERYNAKIEYLDSTGTNDLMVTSEPLDAVFDETETTIIGNGGWSKFGDDTNLQTAEVNVIRKPFTKEQLKAELDKVPGHAEGMHERNFEAAMNEGMDKRLEDALQKLEDQTAESKAMNKKRIMDKKKLDAAGKQREWELKEREIDEHHQFRTEAIQKDMADLRNQFQQLINEFSVERIYEVPFEATDQLGIVRMNKGMFLGFKINMDKPNPWIPSNVRLRFATLDSRKLIEIPTSKHQHIYSIASHSRHITEAEEREVRENWDQQKKGRDRETRYIATGNILQGMTKYAKGRLIEFNMKDGTQEVGIIMPENWKKPDEKVYRIPIKRATDIIKRLHPTEFIEDYRGDILIFKKQFSDPQWYELRVPASKARGQKYWSHEGLRALMRGNDFEQRGDRMVGEFPESRLDAVIDILDSRFKIAMEADGDNIQSALDNTDSKQMERNYPGVVFRKPKDRGGLSNPYDTPVGVESRKHVSERILPSPITGVKPKPIDQIQFDFGQALGGKDIRYRKRPAKGAIGAHTKGINLVAIKFNQDMDTAAHELGHYMDIAFGLLGPESYGVWDDLRSELEKIWDWGSQPQEGDPNPELTHMKEGLAEFIRALVVNPGETKEMFPATYSWFKQRVSQNQKAWEGFNQFSDDVRIWHGATAAQKIGSQMDLDVDDHTKSPLAFSRTNREGYYQTTIWDKLGNRLWFIYEASVGAWKWAMDKRGIDVSDFKTNDPETNFEYLIRNALGFDVKAENIHYKGFVDFNRNRIYDDVTGEPLSWNLWFSQVPSYTWKDYKDNIEEVLHYMAAYRAVEIPWKLASKQARIDLSHVKIGDPATMVIPPLKILAKMPYVVKKYGSVINAVLKAIEDGDLDRDAAFWPEKRYTRFQNGVILGIAQEGEYDFKIAEEAVKEFEALEQTDPDKFAWMTEFMRVGQKISEWTIDYAVEAGLITPDLGEQIKAENLSYLAFKRAFNWSAKESVEGRDVSLNPLELDTSKGIPEVIFHGILGSQKRIKHPIAEMMGFVHNLIQMADYNYALMSFAQAFQGWNASYEEGVTNIGEIAYISSTKEPDGIPFKHKGVTFWIVIRNPEVRRNFDQILRDDNHILKIISYIPKTLQRSIVTALQFMLRNTPRDIGGYLVYGQDQKYQRLKHFLPSETDRDMFELSGGGQFGYVARNKKGYMKLMKDIMIKAAKDPKKWLHNPWKWVEHKRDQFVKAASISERLTRMLQFKASVAAAKARGASDAGAYTYAAFQARDLTDFQAAGEYVKFLNQFIIFSGAAIRGLEKVARTTRQNPARMAKRFTFYALIPSLVNSLLIAAFASSEDQKRYINLPDYIKDMFYVIPAGDGWIIIPKPFEIGAAASVGQRLLDMILIGDEDAFSKAYLRSFNHLINPYDLAGIMGGFSGVAAIGLNYDFFRQKYIIPPHEKDLAVSSRVTDTSSRFGQHIQKLSDFVSPGRDNPKVDARMVDAFVQGQFAYWGEIFLKAYEGVTNIGDPDPIRRRWRFDVEDLALYKNDQVFGTPNVQWVLRTEKEYPKEVKYIVGKGVDNFQKDLYDYLSDEIQSNPKMKKSEGAYIRDFAEMIKNDIEAYLKENNTSLDMMATEDVEYRKSLRK